MSVGERQLGQWRGAFGDAYVDRNPVEAEAIHRRARCFSQILSYLQGRPPRTIFEGGCNVGLNLRALRGITGADLFAIEPNAKARDRLAKDQVLAPGSLKDATLAKIPFADRAFDLVFTSGVLIHVPDDALDASYRELHRVTARYILSIEYFSPEPVTIKYRGHDDLLFKRDYGDIWLRLFPDLESVAEGFFWRRTTGMDNLNWWLFRKP
jgi:spore coat polysaccharide biosynthesis protein SpsF